MKLVIDKKKLQSVLNYCSGIVDRRATMPILANLVLSTRNNRLTISASDLEVTAVASVAAEIEESGSTTVNAKIFNDIIRELPDGNIQIELSEAERLLIKAGGATLKVFAVSDEAYPTLPGIGINTVSKISATKFLDMINKTIFAVSNDETSQHLTGVCLANQGSNIRMVATDGHRISIVDRSISGLKIDNSVIIPKKGLIEVKKYLSELEDAEVGLAIKDGFLVISTDQVKFSIRLIDAEFPDYQQVVPKESISECLLEGNEFGRALKRVSLLATDQMKGVRLNFKPGKLEIKSSSPELGEAKESIKVDYQGDPVEIGFNSLYLQDLVNTLSDYENVKIKLNGALGPGMFLAEEDPQYFCVVMPMRLS